MFEECSIARTCVFLRIIEVLARISCSDMNQLFHSIISAEAIVQTIWCLDIVYTTINLWNLLCEYLTSESLSITRLLKRLQLTPNETVIQ